MDGDQIDNAASTTATLENEIWEVKCILAEKRDLNGTIRFLAEFQGFPLSEADWLPQEELGDDLLAEWDKQKDLQRRGWAKKFKIRTWKTAALNRIQAEAQTTYAESFEQVVKTLDEYSDDSESSEDSEDGSENEIIMPSVGVATQDRHEQLTILPISARNPLGSVPQAPIAGIGNITHNLPADGKKRKVTEGGDVSQPKKRSKVSSPSQTVETHKQKGNDKSLHDTFQKPLRILTQDGIAASSSPGTKSMQSPEKASPDGHGSGNLEVADLSGKVTDGRDAAMQHRPEALRVTQTGDEAPAGTKVRRKKSVHWSDQLIQESESVNAEDSLFVNQDKITSFRGESLLQDIEVVAGGSPAPASSVDDSTPSPNFSKLCRLDQVSGHTVVLEYEGLGNHRDAEWFSSIAESEPLIFTHTCTARDFTRLEVLLPRRYSFLSGGGVSSTTFPDLYEKYANKMAVISLGLVFHGPKCSVLIFPTNCRRWSLAARDISGASSTSSFALSFRVFRPLDGVNPSTLAPILPSRDPWDRKSAQPPLPMDTKNYLGPSYDELMPHRCKETGGDHIFLAFAPGHETEASFISIWLRRSSPKCQIYTSMLPGQWAFFEKQGQGVIIIHEDAIPVIRRFPRFFKILSKRSIAYTFWVFTRAIQPWSAFPSTMPVPCSMGDIRLSPVFKHGLVVLLTPSFLVSQPQQAYNVVKWFWKNFYHELDTPQIGRLFVCHNIDRWLLELTEEKTALRRRISAKAASSGALDRKALSTEAMTAREKTNKILRRLADATTNPVGGPLIYAPKCINGNDEQSLINWFGHWSVAHMDQFRKFVVVGSSDSCSAERLRRQVAFPDYSGATTGHLNATPAPSIDQSQLIETSASTLQSPGASDSSPMHQPNDDPRALTQWLTEQLNLVNRPGNPLRIYRFPVSYWNPDMPFHFGDIWSSFKSYEAWLKFQPPSSDPEVRGSKCNTLLGLFYTLEGKWDPARFDPAVKSFRRPWLAILRPCNLHFYPWTQCELLIWDPSVSTRLRNVSKVGMDHLTEAQRQLAIQTAQLRDQDPDVLPLERVWIGGFGADADVTMNALEKTKEQMRTMYSDIRTHLPVPKGKLSQQGWKLVDPESAKRRSLSPDKNAREARDVSVPSGSTQVVHPPHVPSGGDAGVRSTQCANRLFAKAQEAQARARGSRTPFLYDFPSTETSYRQQDQEGRAFSHIKVAPWESLLKLWKIDDPKEV
ncbi:hypothetical protein S40293_03025 [Stachybotrys chartarum IBT 40293]|nr:hypothetical protein S40293_03025 [Stachybotrys chartarum IBT 40293]